MPSRLRSGVAVFIRRTIKIGVRIVDTSHTDLIWIKLCRKFFKLKKDLHIGGIYISPASSNYTKRTNVDKTLFDKLESDIIKFQQNSSVLLLGDLNAHISSDDLDFIYNEEDDVATKVLPGNYGIDNMHTFRNTSIHQSTNEYGKNVLELCIGLQLRILNGRTIGDTVGRPTFHGYNGSSIDDYCICSADFMYAINKFQVLDFNVTFSDHCPLLVEIQSLYFHQAPECLRKAPSNCKWDDSRKAKFETNISNVNKQIFLNNLLKFSNDAHFSIGDRVEHMLECFSSTLHEAAEIHSRNSHPRKLIKKRKRKKKWYDDNCDSEYRHLKHLSRHLACDPFNTCLRSRLYSGRREYYRLIRKKHRTFKAKLLNGLMESDKRNPKEFWSCVNDLMEKQKADPSADIESSIWTNYFKSLMNIDYPNDLSGRMLYDHDSYGSLDNSILNRDISAEEVLKAVKSLKSGKSCGIDEISNEMLQMSVPVLSKHFLFLFNFILQNGTYPSNWKENVIKPIYKGGGTSDPSNYRGIAISSCFSKLFSRILFNRLDSYIEDNNVIGLEQIGFRKNCRTSDHILTLKTLIEKSFQVF